MAQRVCLGCGEPLETTEVRLCAQCSQKRKDRFSKRSFESGPALPAKKKVLVVDDDLTLRRMVTSRLENKNYEVITASNGAEALEKIKEENPNLMILDVLMPGMTGYDLIKKMKNLPARLRNIPVILVTGKGSMKDFFEQWEVYSIFQKPFDGALLVAKVEEAIGASNSNLKDPAVLGGGGSSKRLLVISHLAYTADYVRNYLEPKNFWVITASEAVEAVRLARSNRLDFIAANFCEDPLLLSVEGIYRRLRDLPETKHIPFVVFCERGKLSEAAKTFQDVPILAFDKIDEAAKKIEAFINTGVIS